MSASVGIAFADLDATAEIVLRHADAAKQLAKQRGRGRVELFDETLRARSERRRTTTSEIQQALDLGQFVVHYQPIVDLRTGAMVSAEALVRWEHPERGLMSPADFVGLAEESGLIVPIGSWVLEQACREPAKWQETDPELTVAVSLSVRQLAEPDVVTVVTNTLKRSGTAADRLSLELRESLFMEDRGYFGAKLACLKAAGVRLSIDDFGIGYSSLSYLRHFPVDHVKVDRAFVAGLGAEPHAAALVSGIVAMADAMELGLTAEGVEAEEQLAILLGMNCERAQGYLLARPMPAADIRQLVVDQCRWSTVDG
jgi:EAL domain-containing protein (putative c-di-GMP-specific phosphodiesterase class I)